MNCNQTVICGEIIKIDQLRYTPAGKAVIEFALAHHSKQIEAGIQRQVICEIPAVALADTANMISTLTIGSLVKLTGFLAKKSRISSQLALHVTHIDII
ncbi:MAG TPA: primosomal replication protein N [Nitrosomonas nitrosa]|nr:primosomal replication protein N [Nitrosomonas nitrosa]